MTVGQRIAQKRKELGLSQEGLGARLGVSRQAIYKWESDAALPEIEKLVNLSREFSVSIDWLLGQEDGARGPQELTPEQLRMVEEIVGRYLAAQPKPEEAAEPKPSGENPAPEKPRKRRRWPYVLAGLVLAAAFYSLFTRLDQMRQENQNLQMSVANIRADVNSQIDGITQRVEDILQRQNALTAEQSAEVTSTNYAANTVTISARAVPRTYTEGMTAEFLLESGGETATVPGSLENGHAFTAEVTGPLSDDISISVAFINGDQRETQLLNQFSYLYSNSFPAADVVESLWGSQDIVCGDAAVRVSEGVFTTQIDNVRLGLFRDKKLLAWYERLDEQPSTYVGDWPNTEFFHLDGEWTMEPGHEYCLAAFVTDEYGRERVYPSVPVAYDPEEGFANYVDMDYYAAEPEEWDY